MDIDTTIALVTLDEAKEYLNMQGAEEDEILGSIVNGVSAMVGAYLGRNVVQQTFTEYYNGNGESALILRNFPIVSVTSIHEDSLRVFGTDTVVDFASDIIVEKQTGILRNWNDRSSWETGTANIKIVYVAGYTAAFAGGTMPHGIRLGTKRLVDLHYRQGYTHRKLDTSSEGVGGIDTNYRPEAIPNDVQVMLNPFRRKFSAEDFAYAS